MFEWWLLCLSPSRCSAILHLYLAFPPFLTSFGVLGTLSVLLVSRLGVRVWRDVYEKYAPKKRRGVSGFGLYHESQSISQENLQELSDSPPQEAGLRYLQKEPEA